MKYIAIPVLTIFFLSSAPLFAQETMMESMDTTVEQKDTATVQVDTGATVEVKKPIVPSVRNMLKARTDEFKAKVETTITERKGESQVKREEIKTSIEARKAEFHAKRKEVKAAIDAHKAEIKAKIQAIKKEHLSVRKEFVYGRLVSAAAIIESRQARVSALLEKMKANGKEVASAEASLAVSIEALASAKASIASLKAAHTATEAESGTLKAIAQKAEASLKEARLALIKALDSIAPEVAVSTSVETTVE